MATTLSIDSIDQLDWRSENSFLILSLNWKKVNPSKYKQVLSEVEKLSFDEPSIVLSSSGTLSASKLKLVVLPLKSLLCSAESVNKWIKSDSNDVWLNALPISHVGGLSIFARSFLSDAEVIDISDQTWNVEVLVKQLTESKISILSLVFIISIYRFE